MGYNRNVLAELLNDPETEAQPEQAELIRLIYRRGPREVGIERAHLPGSIQDSKDPEGNRKKKATYYLSEKVLVELCEAKARIKVQVPSELRAKVSMSRIVDYAVGAILEEFNLIGNKSDLMHQFLTDRRKRSLK
jgi:hypothetical protein